MSSDSPSKIAAIVVTHNRLTLLKGCVEALKTQTRKLDEIIVVDNASTDGTGEWLATQAGITIIKQENLGSAGGQYAGIKTAFQHGHDWVWCMDDDTLPTAKALEALTECPYFIKEKAGFLACLSLWKDGSSHISNGTNPDMSYDWRHRVLDERCIPVVSAAFVGIMFSRIAIQRVGFPLKEYFIWSDDVEYTLRVSREFRCYVVLDSKVYHQTKENVGSVVTDNYSMKTRCFYRNLICTNFLTPVSWPRRIKRSLFFFIAELRNAQTWSRRFAIIRFSLAAVPFYLKVRKVNLHE